MDMDLLSQTNAFLKEASTNGLRTLMIAMRVIEEKEMAAFQRDCYNIEEQLEGKEGRLA